MDDATNTTDDVVVTRDRVLELQAALSVERELRSELQIQHDRLLGAYQALQQQLELIRRRLYDAKAERIDTEQLQIEFADKLAELDKLAEKLGATTATGSTGNTDLEPADSSEGEGEGEGGGEGKPGGQRGKRPSPTGRRNLKALDVPEERIELPDPAIDGVVERIGADESSRMMWRRAGYVRVVTARIKYRTSPTAAAAPAVAIVETSSMVGCPAVVSEPPSIVAPMSPIVLAKLPPEMIDRSFGTPSLWAHVVSDKLCDGLPLHRQEDRFARAGFRIDRGTLCRWMHELGMTVGASVVHAMHEEAMRTAFCIATDATGVLVQPIRGGDQKPRSCARGHYFVQIADADHVFFEYTAKETSAAVGEMFRGFSGYVQADAKSVYDFLYRPPDQRELPEDGEPDLAVRHEVGCWSHLRTKVWEAAIVTKDVVAREGLARIARIFALDRTWKARPRDEIKALREAQLRPHVDAFFVFAATEYERVRGQRGLLRTALGYAHRQQGALTRFFDDGRLKLTNNGSERELRRIATGRKAWLFVGSDDHAQSAGNLLTLVASARLHKLDPEAYLRDLFRVLPQWPRERYLELAPKYWLATRARMVPAQLAVEVGWLTIPPPLAAS